MALCRYLLVLFLPPIIATRLTAQPTELEHFERRIRPLLVEHCFKCHGSEKTRGGLRLDSADGVRRGGESGPTVVPGKPEESLLVKAVRQTGELRMPPNGKLSASQIADLETWVKAGAKWPGGDSGKPSLPPITPRVLVPDSATLRPALQAWYRADTLPLGDSKPVHVWPDAAGQGRDLTQTHGVRKGGVGTAPLFVAASTVRRRPAVRFDVGNGLATSPDRPVQIKGNATLTLVVVMNLQPHTATPPYDGILGIGNPANPGADPGRPLAALVQIQRTGKAELQFAGGWNHNATLGAGSFEPLYNRPLLLTVIKQPGPMRTSTQFYLDGQPVDAKSIGGRDTIPDIRHRDDIGLYLGKALEWCGHIKGDVAEVIVYNRALADQERQGLESHLCEKYGFITPAVRKATTATFTAEEKNFWSFRPVNPITPPDVKDAGWAQSPIDRFVLATLQAKGLRPNPPADRRALIRRATFDLIGLPPTPEEVEAFLKDDSPEAFARVVDRLLASPHHGERWARNWLDVVRYAETTANDANAVMRYAWRYRDYVVRAFNQDLPYDRFIVEQLAGDLLPATTDPVAALDRVVATGFLMVGPKALAETDKEQSRLDVIDDQIDVMGRAFLGMTVACARCHDHKFDPIRTVDYYALAGIFRSTSVFRDEVRNASMWQEWPLTRPGAAPVMVMAPKEATPINLRVHLRGNRHTLGATVPRRYLQVIAGEDHPPLTTEQSGRLELARWIAAKDNPLTARVMVNRLWQHHFGVGLVSTSDNFGTRGEVPSHPELLDWLAAEFVKRGWSVKAMHRLMMLSATYQMTTTPSETGLRLDPNNRLLWRMPLRRLDAEAMRDSLLACAGRLDPAPGGSESGEFLFGRGEVIDRNRDFFRPNQVKADDAFYSDSRRRSIYLPVVRNAVPDVLALFDAADPNGVTPSRNDTTVASQALFLLNHRFVREQAQHFAARLLASPQLSDQARIALGYRFALSRLPTQTEQAEVLAFLESYRSKAVARGKQAEEARRAAWQSFCQMLLISNEFLYLD